MKKFDDEKGDMIAQKIALKSKGGPGELFLTV